MPYITHLFTVLAFASSYLFSQSYFFAYNPEGLEGLNIINLYVSFILISFCLSEEKWRTYAVIGGVATFILLVSHGLAYYISIPSAITLSSAMALYYLCNQERISGKFLYFLGLVIACKALFLLPEPSIVGLAAGFIFITAEIGLRQLEEGFRQRMVMDIYDNAAIRKREQQEMLAAAANAESVDEDVLAYERRQLQNSKPQITLVK